MNYTSIEQSKKLLELGLNPDTADMCYLSQTPQGEPIFFERPAVKGDDTEQYYKTSLPCWSVGALLEIIWKSLPSMMLIPGNRFDIEPQYWCTTDNEEICYDTDYYASAIEALYDMICWLLQNNYIKIE